MSVAGEDRPDHGGVALASRVGAQLLDPRSASFDFRRTFPFVRESGENEPIDPIRFTLCEGRRGNRA